MTFFASRSEAFGHCESLGLRFFLADHSFLEFPFGRHFRRDGGRDLLVVDRFERLFLLRRFAGGRAPAHNFPVSPLGLARFVLFVFVPAVAVERVDAVDFPEHAAVEVDTPIRDDRIRRMSGRHFREVVEPDRRRFFGRGGRRGHQRDRSGRNDTSHQALDQRPHRHSLPSLIDIPARSPAAAPLGLLLFSPTASPHRASYARCSHASTPMRGRLARDREEAATPDRTSGV